MQGPSIVFSPEFSSVTASSKRDTKNPKRTINAGAVSQIRVLRRMPINANGTHCATMVRQFVNEQRARAAEIDRIVGG
jgi:bacterioferritin-associated ferredoxin